MVALRRTVADPVDGSRLADGQHVALSHFKNLNLIPPPYPLSTIFVGCIIFLVWLAPKPVLLGLASAYVGSGVALRIGGLLRRRSRRSAPNPRPEHQVG